jgi:ABC-type glycerol-3-phosphate transport system substrate-binding protein
MRPSGIKKKFKSGGKQMLKRADGSVSQRGLWDNIRAAAKRNKAAGKRGKKPTAAMLKQERKIKAKGK